MKFLTACSFLLLGPVAAGGNAALAANACEALVQQGTCVFATSLPNDADDPIGDLSGIEGRVLASAAEGFTPVRSDVTLKIGDRVIVTDGAKATLRSGPFPSEEIAAPAIVDASSVSGCGCLTVQSGVRTFAQSAGGANAGGGTGTGAGGGAGAAGGGAGAGGIGAAGGGVLGSTAASLGVSTGALAAVGIGATAAIVGVTAAVVSNNNNDEPVSP
ncbi:hypothetical protein [Amorphus sp. MBR-141]